MRFSKLLNAAAELPSYVLPGKLAQRVAGTLYLWLYELFGRASLQATTRMVRLTLGEPQNNARQIARRSFFAKGRQRCNYRSMSRAKDWPVAQHFLQPGVHAALANPAAPLVILTLHQADYLSGLLTILRLIPLERDIHIIKLAEWTNIEESAYRHFRQYGHTLIIHRLSEHPAKRIVRALSGRQEPPDKPKPILLTFVDVPREFGATTEVRLFDLPFQLTSGPLAIARLAGATVFPVFSSYNDGECEVRAGQPILPTTIRNIAEETARRSGGANRSIEAMAQDLANQIEHNLRQNAEQWEMWPVLLDLFDPDALAESTEPLSAPALARLATLGTSAELDTAATSQHPPTRP